MKTNTTPKVMGIVNINGESFYKESRCLKTEKVLERINTMLAEGADMIDIGACSTRPGSTPVSMEQEWEYLKEPLQVIAKEILSGDKTSGRNLISIDTFHAEIVRRVYDTIGEFTVNDISAGEDDTQMLETLGALKLPYIAMHKRGTPNTMQGLCNYPDGVTNEVIRYFKEFEKRAANYNITDYIIDPGWGFAKTLEQNYELLNGIPKIRRELATSDDTPRDLLVGISRKGMIWKLLDITPEEALCGTAALNLQALLLGASIIRVHDVKEGVQCIKLQKAFAFSHI